MSEAPALWRNVLEAMTNGWTTPTAIALRLGRDEESTTDLLAQLDEAGLIEVREPEGADRPVVTISPKGSSLLRPAARRPRDGSSNRPAAWPANDYRPSRPRIAVTAAGSVAS